MMTPTERYNRELYHYGIKGMKWGVRRYQNKDGSLTESGRLREKGANRKRSLIKEQLGVTVDKRVFYKHDMEGSLLQQVLFTLRMGKRGI